ncbi:hypothetical protein BXT86_03130 [candidate division WOR-3 bacterium 4484_100]|uniref:Uncharacterized protein n=1 Tax=candidate division WOR-3 bacterium 4484_100 TaxID=1936077 RepID=A0A1V4QGA8_UNCW3|nr:MAG: hypothetical protein BXT86_03130 [candidate division WOR-3 bacterium 4484_100]
MLNQVQHDIAVVTLNLFQGLNLFNQTNQKNEKNQINQKTRDTEMNSAEYPKKSKQKVERAHLLLPLDNFH